MSTERAENTAGARVGIDIGGTFTDAVALVPGSEVGVVKVRTTPSDFSEGFEAALDAARRECGIDPRQVSYLVHGSTVATNALIEGNVARVGLITTAGFRDVLEIGTGQRASMYDLLAPKPPPLVPRELRLEVRERVGADGAVLRPLEQEDVVAAAKELARREVGAVAVCLLFSFINPTHEEQIGRMLDELLPGLPVSLSSRVAPEIREFIRTSTTVVNASLVPLVGSYLGELQQRMRRFGIRVPPFIMRSNGGVSGPDVAASRPAELIASGPAAGVIGAARIAARHGELNVITFDMGGTTADVSLVEDGLPRRRFLGHVAGYPVNLPQIDVLSVGAGGGSIASVDKFGSLTTGPESAGSEPGPAGYGNGGELPTVTDAHIVLGTLEQGRFLAGDLALDKHAARRALEREVARPLQLSVREAATAVLRVANATMARGLRLVSVERGRDPRQLSLFAFGGAGPMHAAMLADELGIPRVLIPRHPGVTSALGLLLSDAQHDIGRTWRRDVADVDMQVLGPVLQELEADGRRSLRLSGFADSEVELQFEADLRYKGQAYDLTVPLGPAELRDPRSTVPALFHLAHERAYGHASSKEIELMTLRLRATGLISHALATPASSSNGARRRANPVPRTGSSDGGYAMIDGDQFDRPVNGPAIILQSDTTIVVPAGWSAQPGAADVSVLDRSSRGPV